MRPLQGYMWGCALAALAVFNVSAQAAWNNVFQVCCNNCRSAMPAPVVSSYGDPCCQPRTNCTTRYVQRAYYEPYTTYKATTVVEPVVTYQKSYYYETVTAYRYTCQYDPCTCSYRSVACPYTAYQLRERCCPVTRYLQRTCMTPVTAYRTGYYWIPETTCCTTTTGGAVAAPPQGATTVPAPSNGGGAAPGDGDLPPAPPNIDESRKTPTGDSTPDRNPLPPGTMPRATNLPRSAPPAVRFDRIASNRGSSLKGKLLDDSRRTRANAKVLFVSVDHKNEQKTVVTDRTGAFTAQLRNGGWLVYTYDARGRHVFVKRIEVRKSNAIPIMLVSR